MSIRTPGVPGPTGYKVSRLVVQRDGSMMPVVFSVPNLTPGLAARYADMLKHNQEVENHVHPKSKAYTKADFQRVLELAEVKLLPSKKEK